MISTAEEVVSALLLRIRARDTALAVRNLMIVRRERKTGQEADHDLPTKSTPSILALAPTLVIAEIATHVPTVDLRQTTRTERTTAP